MVAATSVTHRFSTPGSNASCWALLNRWTSSTKSTVSRPRRVRSARACSIAARTSFTPADTAETSTNARSVCLLTIAAIVVFPVPGGPQSSTDIDLPPLDQLPQGRALGSQLRLADELVEGAWPHPHREGCRGRGVGGQRPGAGRRPPTSSVSNNPSMVEA